jgi:MYXO-CTERM domain-containing protein
VEFAVTPTPEILAFRALLNLYAAVDDPRELSVPLGSTSRYDAQTGMFIVSLEARCGRPVLYRTLGGGPSVVEISAQLSRTTQSIESVRVPVDIDCAGFLDASPCPVDAAADAAEDPAGPITDTPTVGLDLGMDPRTDISLDWQPAPSDAAAAGDAAPIKPPAPKDGGCSCTTGGRSSSDAGGWLALALATALLRRRHARRSSPR